MYWRKHKAAKIISVMVTKMMNNNNALTAAFRFRLLGD